MSSDAMTQLAISRPQRLITAFRIATFVIRRLAMVPRSAASSLSDHEARYVNAFTRLGRVPAVRPHIGEVVATRLDSVLADALKHLVTACKNNGWLVAGTSSAKSGSVLL
ncbi:hypothetical protein [Bradyrhizobium sp. RDM4]|uniref:hypothetical protein n=1 Tax=Bradyrhizobium sp. RDM4 TaxID=3378765 RepID=UPI0038FC8850